MPLPAASSVSSAQLQILNPICSTQGFSQCSPFFANGKPPFLSEQPKLRAPCYDTFAMLHKGQTKAPIFVAQRLNNALEEDANEKRTHKCFREARLPREERTKRDRLQALRLFPRPP